MKKITLFLLSFFLTLGVMATTTDLKLSYKTEVKGWTSSNPNTHFGGITITCNGVEHKLILTTTHLATSELKLDASGEISLAYTRDYRGFDFVGFSIDGKDLGQTPTLTAGQKKKLAKGKPLVVKFKTDGTKDVTLFYDDAPKAYRIPAIGTTGTGRIVAVSDYRVARATTTVRT